MTSIVTVFFAALPLFIVGLLLIGLLWPATRTMPVAWLSAVVIGAVVWGMPASWIVAASISGVLTAIQILFIVFGALVLLYTMLRAGAFSTLNRSFTTVSEDRRVQIVLVAFFLSAFIEGAAGFGTPAAVVAPLLLGLGFPALAAVVAALIGHAIAVTYGAVGTPIIVGIREPLENVGYINQVLAGNDQTATEFAINVAAWAATYHLLIGFMMPLFAVGIVVYFFTPQGSRTMEPIIEGFQRREGVRVNTIYQGCGSLNAQMSTIREQNPDQGFPDAYLACDVYYLDPVSDWFEDKATVTKTRIVIATQKDNPYNIEELEDLAQPGLRLVIGHASHCTIGGLTERLFKAEGLYDEIMENVVEQQPSSGMMVPPVASGAADASLAYYNDTLPEKDRLHVVEIDSEYANAVQPFGIASTSRHKQLMLRLYRFIGSSREVFEELGFGWELGRSPDDFELVAPSGVRPPRVD